MLKLTIKFNILHTWSVCQGILFTRMYNLKFKMRSSQKKNRIKIIYIQRGVYNTSLFFQYFFQVTGNLVKTSDNFFTAEHEYQSHFSLSRPTFPKIYVKNLKKDHINRYISIAITLCLMNIISIFFMFTRWITHKSLASHENHELLF